MHISGDWTAVRPGVTESKRELRGRLLAARRELGSRGRTDANASLRQQARECPEIAGARTVAAYVSVGAEPDTRALLDELRDRDVRVILPALLPDGDLDWAPYDGASSLESADRGLLEPATQRLGVDAVREADAALLPAVAVDVRGFRLGRGGGSYDRVLARVNSEVFTVAYLYDGEVVDAVPTEPHDRQVRAALTPSATRRFA